MNSPIFTIAYDGAYEEAEALEKKGRAGIDFKPKRNKGPGRQVRY
jgi:hypothetical protein